MIVSMLRGLLTPDIPFIHENSSKQYTLVTPPWV
jgi:hypothetical protein